MNLSSKCKTALGARVAKLAQGPQGTQDGLVLIVSIVLLAIVSILAALATRNATSAESVAGNVRLTELATQSAEFALRHCEQSVAEVIAVNAGAAPSFPTEGFDMTHILPVGSNAWESAGSWDTATSPAYVVPLSRLNQSGLAATYRRPPECMVAPIAFQLPTGAMTTTAAFVVTARGFGPEVPAADIDRSRPIGTEVWLQSHIELE